MRIVVTEEHIERGEKGSRKCCAIALAAAESECEDVEVGYGSILYTKNGLRHVAYLPPLAQLFIRQFDQSVHLVEPIEFDLVDIELYEDQS